jgi:hypothetical protein
MAISAEKVIKIVEDLSNVKANWSEIWDDCVRYSAPYKKTSAEYSTKGEYHPSPVNGTAQRACSSLAGNLYANGCAIGQEWFAWDINKPTKDITQAMKNWAIDATKTTLRYLGASNFYTIIQICTQDLCIEGTAIAYVEFVKGKLAFRVFSVESDIYLQTNDKCEVDTLARKFKLSAKEAFQMFGENNCSQKILEAVKQGKQDVECEFIQFVYPRNVYGEAIDCSRKDKKNMPFGSVFVDVEEKKIIKEEGFKRFPFACARFYPSGREAYGRSPTMIAMEDIKTLQKATSALIDSAEYASNPAIAVDDRAESFDTSCGAINRVSNLSNGMIQTIDLGNNMPVNQQLIEMLEDSVRETFFYDLFMNLEQHSYMTAREVDARELQKAQSISPVVTSYQGELLGGILKLVYFLLRKNKIIPAPPAGVGDEDVNITYTSRLNTFLKLVNVDNMMTALNQANGIFQACGAFPQLTQYVNINVALQDIAYGNNVNPALFYDEETTKKLQEAEQNQAQQMQAMEMAKQLASKMPLNEPIAEGSVADTFTSSVGGKGIPYAG